MEDRVTETREPRPPMAVVALAAILVITAGWWALALWPLSATAPEWIARTREVCFGATRTGLPNAGGWLLLIGEPIGMLAVLYVVWGTDLRVGLARVHQRLAGKFVTVAVSVAMLVGLGAAAQRVAATVTTPVDTFDSATPLPSRGSTPAAPLALRDQLGATTELRSYRGRWVMLTFAFGHCDDICPVIVQQALRARIDEQATDIPLLVVSLDPWRDTPDRLPAMATGWGLAALDRVLSGSVPEVNAALDAWRIARQRDETTGDVAHGSTIVLIDPAGEVAWRIEGAPHRVREALRLIVSERGAD
jgi:protein SCO1